ITTALLIVVIPLYVLGPSRLTAPLPTNETLLDPVPGEVIPPLSRASIKAEPSTIRMDRVGELVPLVSKLSGFWKSMVLSAEEWPSTSVPGLKPVEFQVMVAPSPPMFTARFSINAAHPL